MKIVKRMLAMVLCALMIVTSIPVNSYAAEVPTMTQGIVAEQDEQVDENISELTAEQSVEETSSEETIAEQSVEETSSEETIAETEQDSSESIEELKKDDSKEDDSKEDESNVESTEALPDVEDASESAEEDDSSEDTDKEEFLTDGAWLYKVNEEGYAVIMGYTDYSVTELSAPEQLGGHSVVGIGEKAFINNTSLKKMYVHGNVTTIESDAFEGVAVKLSGYNGTAILSYAEKYGFNSKNMSDSQYYNFVEKLIDYSYTANSNYQIIDDSTVKMHKPEARLLSVGGVFYLPEKSENGVLGIAFEVLSMSTDGDWVVLGVKEADPYDVLESIDIEDDNMMPDWSTAEWADGVEITEEKLGTIGGEASGGGSVNLTFKKDLKNKKENKVGEFSVSGSFSLTATGKIHYNLLANDLQECSFIVSPTFQVKGSISTSVGDSKDNASYRYQEEDYMIDEIYLGKVTLISVYQLMTVDAAVYMKVSASGEVSLTWKTSGEAGVEWNHAKSKFEGVWRWNKPSTNIDVKATVDIGPAAALEMNVVILGKLMSLEYFKGVEAVGSWSTKHTECLNLDVDLKDTLEYKVDFDLSKIKKGLTWGYKITLYDKALDLFDLHYEIGRGWLNQCTYDTLYTVDFCTNCNIKLPPLKVDGGTIEEPEVKLKGNTILGWYTDKDFKNKWDFAKSVVDKNITLYAKWEIFAKTVTFDTNGHGTNWNELYPPGSEINEPEKLKDMDYIFEGWYKDSACKTEWLFNVDVMPTDNMTLYAKWTYQEGYDPYNISGTSSGSGPSYSGGKMVFGGHEYQHIATYVSFSEAKQQAEAAGGYLVTINSPEEQAAILSYVQSDCAQDELWLGINNTTSWTHWLTGEKVDYTNWNSNPTTSANQYNGSIIRNSGKWNTISNSETRHFVIEWGPCNVDPNFKNVDLESTVNYAMDAKTQTTAVTGYNIQNENIDINPTYAGTVVTSIVERAFQNNKTIKKVEIPNTVTAIGQYAFAGCTGLEEIVIPDSVTSIGIHAFDGCTSLKKVTLSKGMTTLPSYTFYGCNNLVEVNHLNNYTTIGSYAFSGCSSLSTIDYSSKLTTIENYAFSDCKSLVSGNLPDTLNSMGSYAFSGCSSLKNLTIPKGMKAIPNNAFYNCTDLEVIVVPATITSIGSNAFSGVNGDFLGSSGSYIETWCKSNNKKFVDNANKFKVSFSTGLGSNSPITSIKDSTLVSDCYIEVGSRITEPEIEREGYVVEGWYKDPDFTEKWDFAKDVMPEENITLYAKWVEVESAYKYSVNNGVATITDYVGSDTSVIIPESLGGYPVEIISAYAFAGNNNITEISLPAGLKKIEALAFNGCKKLFTIKAVNNNSFSVKTGIIYSSDGAELIYAAEGRVLTSFVVPEGVTTIYEGAFANQKDLGRVEIPDSVIEIQDNAFPTNSFITLYGGIDDCAAKAYASKHNLSYNLYQISFMDGDTLLYSSTWKAGGLITSYYEPTDDFARFGGWYKDEACTEEWDFDSDIMPAGNLSLYLKWDSDFAIETAEDGVLISGYSGTQNNIIIPETIGGRKVVGITANALVSTSQKVIDSLTIPSTVSVIEKDAISGNPRIVIVGDKDSAAETYANDNNLTFEIRSYSVYFDTDGGAEIDSISAIPGENLVLPTPVRSNYRFIGWYKTAAYAEQWTDEDVMPANDITLYAYWKTINSNITDSFSYEVLSDGTASITKYTGTKISLAIPDEINGLVVTAISDYSFKDNNTIQIITIPDSIKSIGSYAFADSSVRTINGAENVEYIGEGCFIRAGGLTNISFLKKVKDIPAHAFQECTSITDATIPTCVERIGEYAFYGCSFLNKVVVPESVTAIGSYAFGDCPKLLWAEVPGTLEELEQGIFDDNVIIVYTKTKSLKILELKQVTKSSVKLTWNEVEGADGYYLFRKQGSAGTYSRVKSITSTEAENFNLSSGTTYYYKIQAYVNYGNGTKNIAESDEVSIKISFLTTPEISSIETTSDTTALMRWSKVTGAEGYEIYRSYDPNGEFTYLKTVSDTQTTNTGLILGMQYYYVIRAYYTDEGEKEYSAWSDVYKFEMPTKYLSAPDNLIARETATGTVLLEWNSVPEADGYDVYRKTSTGSYSLIKSVSTTSTYNYNLSTGQTYSYKVCAYYTENSVKHTTEFSNTVSVTILSIATPSIKSISQSAAGTALISWSTISAADGYELWRCRTENGTYSLMKSVDGTATSNYNLTSGATYFYKVRAYKNISDGTKEYGAYSEPVSITISDIAKTRIKSVVQADGSSAKITWASVTNSEGYEVWRRVGVNGDFELVRDTTGTAVQDRNLMDGQTYYYRIRAYKKSEDESFVYGEFSDELNVRIIATPSLSVVEESTETSIKVMWSKIKSAEGYELWRSDNSKDNFVKLQDCTNNSTDNYNLSTGSTYYYKVRAYATVDGVKMFSSYSPVLGTKLLEIPQITKLAQNGTGGVTIDWKSSAYTNNYELWRSNKSAGSFKKVKNVTGNSTGNYSLVDGNKYYYKVRAYATVGGKKVYSPYGNSMGITLLEAPVITNIEQLSTSSCGITWDIVENATSYKLYRSEEENGTYNLIKTINDTYTTNTNLVSNKRYYYKVKAVMEENGSKHEGAYSSGYSIYISDMNAPKMLDPQQTGDDRILINYEKTTGAAGYEIWRSVQNEQSFSLFSEQTGLSYEDAGLVSLRNYYYKVRAYKMVNDEKVYSAFSSVIRTGLTQSGSKDNLQWNIIGSKVIFSGEGTIDTTFRNNTNITEVEIGDGITAIASQAFYGCNNLVTVKMSNSVKSIGTEAFRNCSKLENINLSNSITSIENYLFYGDSKLTKIIMPNEIVSIGQYAFSGCSSLNSVLFSNKLETIGAYAFQNDTALDNVILPDGVKTLGNYAFANCTSLVKISVPATVTSIYEYTFSGIGSRTAGPIGGNYDYQYGWTRKVPNYAFSRMTNLLQVSFTGNIRNIGNYVCYYCTSLKKAVIGNGVETIGDCAFRYANLLATVELGNLVESIGNYAFQGSTKLNNFVLPDSVKSIGSYAFADCTALANITFGNGIETINANAFQNDTKLNNVVLPEGLTTIGNYAFNNCTDLVKLTVPKSAINLYEYSFAGIGSKTAGPIGGDYDYQYGWNRTLPNYAFSRITNLTNITIGGGIRNIGANTCYYCSELQTVVLEAGVESIGNQAFRYATNLTTITMNDGLETIGDYAFQGATKLNNVVIPNGVTSIGNYAFNGCTSLSKITVPGSVRSIYENTFSGTSITSAGPIGENYGYQYGWTRDIPNYAFSRIDTLKNIKIGDNIRTIGNYAAYYCGNLQSVAFGENLESIGEYAFRYATNLRTITMGAKVETIGNYAFQGDSKLTSATLSDALITIGERAFADCSELTTVSFGTHLKTVGYYAFYNDVKLNNVILPNGTTNIYNYAFANCSALTNITVPKTVTTIHEYSFSGIGAKTAGPIGGEYDYQYGWTASIPNYAFSRMINLTDVTIGGGVRTIGSNACYYCTGLKNVDMGNSVETIASYAFTYATNLETVSLSSNLETIGEYAFRNDEKLNNVVIPEGVTTIGNYVFQNCTGLVKISVPKSLTNVYEYSFSGIGAKTAGPIGGDYDYQYGWTTSIPAFAFSRIATLTNATIGEGINTIGNNAFYYDTNLTTVSFSDGLRTIGDNAFYGNSLLNNVIIPEGTKTIGNYAFYNCSALVNVTMPKTVTNVYEYSFSGIGAKTAGPIGGDYDYQYGWTTSIPAFAFSRLTKLTDIVIGNGVTTVGNYACYGCNALKTAVIGATVESIGNYAFQSGLKEIRFEGPAVTISNNAFNGITATAYYLIYEQSWTPSVRTNYGGTITWQHYGELGNIQKLSVRTMPTRTNYEIGEEFDPTGLTLSAEYDSGRTMIIYLDQIDLSACDCSTAGEKVITASYNGLSVDFSINVINVVAVTADPSDYPESAHNYSNNMNQTWTYTYPDAARLTITFSASTQLENNYDYIYLYDGNGNQIGRYTGSSLSNVTIEIPSDTFSIKLTSDGSVTYYGFSFSSIVAHVAQE